RFWMLETIREYALEKLKASGEADELARKYAKFFLALAESANLSAERIERGQRHELVVPEGGNLRAAMDGALAAGEVELTAALGVELESYWLTNAPHDGARRMAQLLEREELPPMRRARAVRVRGAATYISRDFEEGNRWSEAALEAFRELGDDAPAAHMLLRLAAEAHRAG